MNKQKQHLVRLRKFTRLGCKKVMVTLEVNNERNLALDPHIFVQK